MHLNETIAIGKQLYLNYVLNSFPLAILYYDYALTFSREVEYFWPNPYRAGSWVSAIFFLNRYLSIFGHIPILIGLVPSNSCHPQHAWQKHYYSGYYGVALQFLVAVLCTMRVYALYSKNNYILLALTFLAVLTVVVGFVAIATESGAVLIRVPHHLFHICHISLGLSDEGGRFLSAAWGILLAFDVAVFALTIYKATKVGYNAPLIQVIVRDGSLYFVVLFLANLANILTLQFAPTLLKNSATPLTNVLSVTLISRLMLRLRSDRSRLGHHNRRHSCRTTDRRTTFNSRFNSSLSEPSSFWFPTIMTTHGATTEGFELESSSSGGTV